MGGASLPWAAIATSLSLLVAPIASAAESLSDATQAASPAIESLRFDHSPELALSGRDARLQLVITAVSPDGADA